MHTRMPYSRRRFLAHVAAVTTVPGVASGETAGLSDTQTLETLRRAWLKDADASRTFGEPAILSQFNDEIYYLRAPLKWWPEDVNSGLPSVTVPAGFVTDLASIPREFWSLLPRDARYMPAAIVHDYLYWQQEVTKDSADAVFKMAMQDLNVRSLTVAVIYAGVRTPFGKWAWQGNARLKAAGEQRILKVFPPSQTIKWSEWKLIETNFDSQAQAGAK